MFGYSLDNPHEGKHAYHQVDWAYNRSDARVQGVSRCGAIPNPFACLSEVRGIPGSASKYPCDLEVAASKVFAATADADCGIEHVPAATASHSVEPNMPTDIGGGAGYAGLTQITPTVETAKSFVES